jgi:hypothetical protein
VPPTAGPQHRLTDWMTEQLPVAVREADDYETIEQELIGLA